MAKKRNTIKVGLIKGNESKISKTDEVSVKSFNETLEKGKQTDEIIQPCLLISRLDYPVDISYGDSVIRLSPRAKEKLGDVNKIKNEKLPNGIFIKELKK
jgi:hypothetical protein